MHYEIQTTSEVGVNPEDSRTMPRYHARIVLPTTVPFDYQYAFSYTSAEHAVEKLTRELLHAGLITEDAVITVTSHISINHLTREYNGYNKND